MKPFVRLMSVCSLVLAGAIAAPAAAHDHGGDVSTTTEAMRGSMHKVFDRALEDAELRPEQKAEVDKLRAEAKKRHEPAKKAKGEFMLAVADQIDTGKVDRCNLAPQVKALAKAKAATKPGDRDAMEKLHSIMDSTQRSRFVDSLRKQFDEAKEAHSTDAIIEKMGRDLKLSQDQKSSLREIIDGLKQIRDAEPGYKEHVARKMRILEAFKGEKFDIDEVAPLEDAEGYATKRIEARLWAAEAVLPVLNEEQRAMVAKKLRDKAQRHIGTQAEQEQEPGQEERMGERTEGESEESEED